MITRKTTKELLGESLRELSQYRPVDKITVLEIVRNCGMSTATFYRYFHDKYELIAWSYNSRMETAFQQYFGGEVSWYWTVAEMVRILESDLLFYRNALKNTEGQNSFFLLTNNRGIELLTRHLRETYGELASAEILFLVRVYLRGASYSMMDWIIQDLPYTTQEVADYLYDAIPETLKDYLLSTDEKETRSTKGHDNTQ